jgi:hypothetical protein
MKRHTVSATLALACLSFTAAVAQLTGMSGTILVQHGVYQVGPGSPFPVYNLSGFLLSPGANYPLVQNPAIVSDSALNLDTVRGVPTLAPAIRSIEPEIVGVGGKIRLRGVNLGTAQTAVVMFHPGVIAEQVERHTPNEIVVRVPVGAQTGNIQVVTGVNAPALRALQTQIGVIEGVETPAIQAEIAQHKAQQGLLLGFGRFSNPVKRFVTAAYMNPKPSIRPVVDDVNGVKIVRNRLIVDLQDFLSFDVALQIADQLNAELVGHFPITNSYVLDLRQTPKDLEELDALMARIAQDRRVAEVWRDLVLELRQVRFADVDVVDRYRHNYNANLNGRKDVWATDRIQAPGAWNLIERFIPNGRAGLSSIKIAVLDSGCDQTHPEFARVDLKKVVTGFVRLRIAGREAILPEAANLREEAYDLGDSDMSQHGTTVISLIGARNGNVIDAATGDRGINGILHNPTSYTIQVYRDTDWSENDWTTLTAFLSVINAAAITRARIMSASYGQPHPINPDTSPRRLEVRVALRKLAHQLNQFRDRLLLVVAAGNEADRSDPEGMRGLITPFEDLNLNGRLDAGEDFDGDGVLDHGNYVAASLGTLPNVITVGAIDQHDQRASFSNWGMPVQIAAPGVDVMTAGGSPTAFTIGGARFDRSSGTSYATPLTAGSAGLLLAIRPQLTPNEVKNYLINTAYEVNTTDGNGNQMMWKTLKTGYAVRQLLVDRGIIGNNQQWTGVSKVVYDGLNMFEIRRGANGRAEGFALRRLTINGWDPCLSHDGRKVAYIEKRLNEYNLREYHFDTDMEVTLVTRGRDRFTISIPIEYSPSNNLMWHLITSDGPCRRKHQLWVYKADGSGSDLIAETMMYNFCEFDPDRNPLEWRRYRLQKGSWRPDNRRWDLDYHYSKGRGNDILVICHSWWQDIRYPQGTLAFPECLTEEFYWSSWSPDGRARVGGRSIPAPSLDYYNLVTLYYDDAQDPYIVSATRSRVELRQEFPMFRAGWSPDGSEIIYLYDFSILNTIRRDRRNVDDRAPRRLIDQARGAATFSWQW